VPKIRNFIIFYRKNIIGEYTGDLVILEVKRPIYPLY